MLYFLISALGKQTNSPANDNDDFLTTPPGRLGLGPIAALAYRDAAIKVLGPGLRFSLSLSLRLRLWLKIWLRPWLNLKNGPPPESARQPTGGLS